MTKNDLEARTKQFAIRVIRLVRALPTTTDGRAIGAQLIRSGTSVGANYRAARRARSRKEFLSRLGVVEEEADETSYWLELIVESDMMSAKRVDPLLQESHELTAIIVKSRITTKRS